MAQQDAVNAHEKTLQALELRKEGYAYNVIADKLGYKSKGTAWAAVNRALKQTRQEPADEVRKLEVERLDALYKAMYPQALKGNQGAVDRCLRIAERRAKLLGLDAPEKQEVATKVVIEIEREAGDGAPEEPAPETAGD